MREPCDLTANEAARRIAEGELTAVALVRSCIERIEAREPEIQAWETLDLQRALRQAEATDAEGIGGPLHGIPFGVKDIIDTADLPTAYGSPIYAGHRPPWDAACVALARSAGGIVMGKTVTAELAHKFPGKTSHPDNAAHTPGGSSSGSAAAVAAGMVPLAIGTQTGGSVIRPAAFCGVVGYKATFGDLSLFGVREQTRSLDTLGLFARSVEDVALLRSVLLGQEPGPLGSVEGAALSIGFCRTPFWDQADVATRSLLEDTARKMQAAGARVDDFDLPEPFSRLKDAARWVSGFEFARSLAHDVAHHADKLSRILREGRLKDGLECSYERYAEAQAVLAECRRALAVAMEGYDCLITPSAPGEAPKGLGSTGNSIFNSVWTDTYVPAVTLPAATGPNGLPLGVQLVGWPRADRRLLEIASWLVGLIR